jgi:glucan biosynthesis protein
MKLLTFQAKRFWWRSFSKTLEDVEDVAVEQEVFDAVVAFYQVEAADAANRASVFRQALKHLKWLANKRASCALSCCTPSPTWAARTPSRSSPAR